MENSDYDANYVHIFKLPKTTPKGGQTDKLYFTAHELYTSECTYVDILLMLTQDFREAIQNVAPDHFLKIFFHPLDLILPINQKLLEELKQRVLVEWDEKPRISDIMIEICSHFENYSTFITEFENINLYFDEVYATFPNFRDAVDQFEELEQCKKLSIKNHLVKPIQRLTQYPLLLRDYLRRLKPDDPDTKEMEQALQMVTEIVEHINQEVVMSENDQILSYLKDRIIAKSNFSLSKFGRRLIKCGVLHKISRKDIHERFFILFSDTLLYLVPVMNEMLRLKGEFSLDQLEVEISNQADNEFIVRSMERSFSLIAYDSTERKCWFDKLQNAIFEFKCKRESFEATLSLSPASIVSVAPPCRHPPNLMRSNSSPYPNNSNRMVEQTKVSNELEHFNTTDQTNRTEMLLGERAPVWVNDNRVSMCQRCMHPFTMMNRRHHCRACGSVVCHNCSRHSYPLKYMKLKTHRVCDVCHDELTKIDSNHNSMNLNANNHSISCADIRSPLSDVHNQSLPSSSQLQSDQNHFSLFTSLASAFNRVDKLRQSERSNTIVAKIPANDSSCTISGYLSRYSKNEWKRHWFLIKQMVLYTYAASEDVAALESLPLFGYKVSISNKPINRVPAESIIELSHSGSSSLYFLADTSEAHERWIKAFADCTEPN